MQVENFNIRVYGILQNSEGQFLLTNETRGGVNMTKFVGGGLEYGEGLKDALIREFKEEMDIDVEIGELFYLTDFLQISAFNPKDQLISVYYNVTTNDWHKVETAINNGTDEQSFQWISKNELSSKLMTFPIDKLVVERLASVSNKDSIE